MDMLDTVSFLLGIAAGGKSASIKIITGTADNPWGDLDVAALRSDIVNNDASAKMELTIGNLTIRSIVSAFGLSDHLTVTGAFYDDSPVAINQAFNFDWDADQGGQLVHLYSTQGGVSSDITSYAPAITTILAVIRHPHS